MPADCRRKTKCGTTIYMAPEICDLRSTTYGVAADLWSLGVLAYELTVGDPPFTLHLPGRLGDRGEFEKRGRVTADLRLSQRPVA